MFKKLETKDYINVGIFTTIYFVIFFMCGMVGYIPILFVLLPLIYPIVAGIPFMLYITKVNKFGMITITGFLLGLLMFATGHTWLPVVTGTICGLAADLIFKSGNYQNFKRSVLGSGVFSLWAIGAMLPMWVMRESYFAYMEASMGQEYAQTMMGYTEGWALLGLFGMAFLAGIGGAFLGRAVLKKHFQRAGIV